MKKTLMIITGESSGELYGAFLVREVLKRWPDTEILAIGGERMEASGATLIGRPGHAFGLIEAIGALKNIRRNFKVAIEHLKERRPSVLVLIDYPDFNISIGEFAKRLGIKVLYYVSPQVWAWRKKRRYRIKDLAQRIAVVLPFEEALYKEIGAKAEFVGHPVMEEIEDMERTGFLTKARAKDMLGIDPAETVISLLPGSRPSELKRHLPVLMDTLQGLARKGFDPVYLMPVAPNLPEDFRAQFEVFSTYGVKVLPPFLDTYSSSVISLRASDMAISASGTVVLQAGLIGVPTVVIYRLSKLTYLIARLLVDVKYITIPNIVLNKEVFPELIQEKAKAFHIIEQVKRFFEEKGLRETLSGELRRLREIFLNRRPSQRVAEIIGEIAGWS